MKKFSDFNLNEEGIVLRILSNGKIKRRIIDMGITPGIKIQAIAFAPFGDPIIAEVRGYKLGIRKSQAMQIITRTENENE